MKADGWDENDVNDDGGGRRLLSILAYQESNR